MKVVYLAKQNYLLISILVFATFLRLYHINFQSIWMDEIYTLNVSSPSLTFSQLFDEVKTKEGFPYLYFIILRGLYAIFGYSEIVVRCVSAFAGVAGVFAIYKLGKHIFNRNAGLISAFLLAINEYHIYYSQEARPYTLFVAVAILSYFCLSVFIKAPTFKNSLWFGLAAGLMLNINFFGLVILFTQGLLLLMLLLFSPKENRFNIFKYSLFGAIVALLMFLPNFTKLLTLFTIKSFWIPYPLADTFTLMFKEILGNSEVTVYIFTCIIVYYAINVFNEKFSKDYVSAIKDNAVNYSFIIIFVWFTCFFGILYSKSFSSASIATGRYFITLLPIFLLVIAIGICLIKNKVAKIAVITSIFVFSLLNLFVVKKYYKSITKSQYREVSRFITDNNTSKSPVYTSLKYWYGYFLEKSDNKQNLIEFTLDQKVSEMVTDSTKIKPFWYADAHNRPYAVSAESQAFLDKYFYVEHNFEGYDAWTRFYQLKTAAPKINFSKFGIFKPVNGDVFNYSLETYDYADGKIKGAGWAYFSGFDATNTFIKVVVVKDNIVTDIPIVKVTRADVTSYFKLNFNADNSGFTFQYDVTALAAGEYHLAIYLSNKSNTKEGLVITDKTFIK